uniref:P2X purinoceptor n=1 Tax=Petromyzon marinus TaxID=7757 RepID=A0AAJ7SKV8_PETMA|nr:P2X purinoceptor 4-like [Petromyzon marinus]
MGCVSRGLCEYETPRIVKIHSCKVSLANRLIQLLIVAYVVGWVFVVQRGYQDSEEVLSSVTTKVKGAALADSAVFDAADYVVPPQEPNSFFVMTNFVLTPNQTQGTCPQVRLLTGSCVRAGGAASKSCEVRAWCPLEHSDHVPSPALLQGAENFTVLIKNSVQFPKFSFFKRNIASGTNGSALRSCRYDARRDPHCPIFRLGDVVAGAGENFQQIALEGGVVGIMVEWNCDLDLSWERCRPSYSFQRLDARHSNETIAPGYNFRFSRYFLNANGTESRALIKAYGVRFVVQVYGQGRKFNIIPTLMNVGSGIALLGVATVVCDVLVLYVFKRRHFYREKKFKDACDEDGVEGDRTPMT